MKQEHSHKSLPELRAELKCAIHRAYLRRQSASVWNGEAPPLLITGAMGALGQAFARACRVRAIEHVALDCREMDIADPASVEAALQRYRPWAIINAADYEQVEAAQQDEEGCYRVNTAGPALLAAVCARQSLPFLTFSSHLVFNGRQDHPYLETDSPTPMSVYGRSKAKAEASVQEILPSALIVCAGVLFGPHNEADFVTRALRACVQGEAFSAANDALVSPAYIPDVVNACLDLLLDGASGLWHLAHAGAVTWEQWARMAAERAGVEDRALIGCPARAIDARVRRPAYSALGTQRGQMLPSLEAAIDDYLRQCGVNWAALQAEQHQPRPVTTRAQQGIAKWRRGAGKSGVFQTLGARAGG